MKLLAAIACALVTTLALGLAEAQERAKFPVSVSSKTLGYGPLWAASKQGFFQRQGLDVELILVRGPLKKSREDLALSNGVVKVLSSSTIIQLV